jgi:hypothetical protein
MQTREYWRSRWWMPSFALALGALMFGAFAIGGVSYVISVALLRRRS